jgi:hypothetical protein
MGSLQAVHSCGINFMQRVLSLKAPPHKRQISAETLDCRMGKEGLLQRSLWTRVPLKIRNTNGWSKR